MDPTYEDNIGQSDTDGGRIFTELDRPAVKAGDMSAHNGDKPSVMSGTFPTEFTRICS